MNPLLGCVLVPFALLVLFCSSAAGAAECHVPSTSYPTIQSAVDDLVCTDVVVAPGTFIESVAVDRSLEITGASSVTTVIEGRMVTTGAGVELVLNSLKVDSAAPSVGTPRRLSAPTSIRRLT